MIKKKDYLKYRIKELKKENIKIAKKTQAIDTCNRIPALEIQQGSEYWITFLREVTQLKYL